MGKSSMRGPDWVDVLTMLEALQALHGVSILVQLAPKGFAIGTVWAVALTAVSDTAAPGEQPRTYTWSRQVGGGAMVDLSAVLYNGCYELEKRLTAGQWTQMEIPRA